MNRDDNLPSIDLHECDLTDAKAIEKVFESYEGKGGIWGLIHVAVSSLSFLHPVHAVYLGCSLYGAEGGHVKQRAGRGE
jgi:hypothetical protein